MIDVQELNEGVQSLGLDKIAFIAEDINGDDHWDSYADPETNGDVFGFDAETCTFKEDTYKYWSDYEIKESTAFEGKYDIIFYGRGPAYTTME